MLRVTGWFSWWENGRHETNLVKIVYHTSLSNWSCFWTLTFVVPVMSRSFVEGLSARLCESKQELNFNPPNHILQYLLHRAAWGQRWKAFCPPVSWRPTPPFSVFLLVFDFWQTFFRSKSIISNRLMHSGALARRRRKILCFYIILKSFSFVILWNWDESLDILILQTHNF